MGKKRDGRMRKKVGAEKWPGRGRIARKVNQMWQKSRMRREKISNIGFEMRQNSIKKDN